MGRWTDRFVGDRMAVDRQFTQRVAASEFSSQEWGTIMTAVELEIERPEDPERARVVADTSKIDQVMPALDQMRDAMGAMGGGAAGGGGAGGPAGGGRGDAADAGDGGRSSGGIFGSIKRSLGLGEDESDQRAEAAAALADEYAMRFQEHLETQGKWEDACHVAATVADDADETAGFPESAAEQAEAAEGTRPDGEDGESASAPDADDRASEE